jgi:membrane-associated phospholipid phosphatase
MSLADIRTARDYNRGVVAPVRWAHMAAAAAAPAYRAVRDWAMESRRRTWAPPLVVGAAAFVLLLPFDGVISRAARRLGGDLSGDLFRQLEWFGEYGQFGAIVVVGLAIWLLDRQRRALLRRWVMAMALAALIAFPMKFLIGRPRPKFDDPWVFLGPFGAYPTGDGVRHAWEAWARGVSDIQAFPSRHAVFACVMSVFLAWMYPRLRGLVWTLAAIVLVCRVLFWSHYATDVAVGAAIGVLAGRVGVGRHWWLPGPLLRLAEWIEAPPRAQSGLSPPAGAG